MHTLTCPHVREGEGQGEGKGEGGREGGREERVEIEREHACLCMFMYVCNITLAQYG
jgi:hypothetical protein